MFALSKRTQLICFLSHFPKPRKKNRKQSQTLWFMMFIRPFYESFAIVFIVSINLLDLDTEKIAPKFLCSCFLLSFVCKSFISSTFSAHNDNFHLFAMPVFLCLHIQLFHAVSFSCRQCWASVHIPAMWKKDREMMESKKPALACTHSLKWIDLYIYKSTLWRHIWIFQTVRNAYMQMIMKCAVWVKSFGKSK